MVFVSIKTTVHKSNSFTKISGRKDLARINCKDPQGSFRILKVPNSCLEILHICNLWILPTNIVIYLVVEHFIFVDFFALKGNVSDVTKESVLW